MAQEKSPADVTPPDETRHGPVPSFQPAPLKPDSGRAPLPDVDDPGSSPAVPRNRAPFPDGSEQPRDKPPKSL